MSLNGLVFSDIHYGKTTEHASAMLRDAKHICEEQQIDFVLLNGDIAEGNLSNLEAALDLVAESPCDNIIYICGNNELECLNENLIEDYYLEFNKLLYSRKIINLDYGNCIIDNVEFVGDMTWFDGTLWEKPAKNDPDWSNDPEVIRKETEAWFAKKYRTNITSEEFFKMQMENFSNNLITAVSNLMAGAVDKLVIATHYSPIKDFLVYGKNPKWDYLNWYMGWDIDQMESLRAIAQLKIQEEPIIQWLVGHTHRHKIVEYEDIRFTNTSGLSKPLLITV